MNVLMEKYFMNELRIDLKKFSQNPTEHETVQIFNHLINKLLFDEPDVERSVPDIYRIVNALLENLQSTVKVFYSEFLEPKQTTVMAVCILGMAVCKQNVLSSGENNLLTILNGAQEKLDGLKEEERQLQHLRKEVAKYTEEMEELKMANQQQDVCMQREQNLNEEVHEEFRKQSDKLKQRQNENELLLMQIDALKNNCEPLNLLIEEKTKAFKKQSTFESKQRKLKQLTEVINFIAESNSLSGAYFVTEKIISNHQKKMQEQQYREKEDKELENELISSMQEATKDYQILKSALCQGRMNTYNLYQHLFGINKEIKEMEDITEDNIVKAMDAHDNYSHSIESTQKFFHFKDADDV